MKHGKIKFYRNQHLLCEVKIMQAECLKERLCGLLVLPELQHAQALWLQPCNSIHTLGMTYSIDLIYLDKNNNICGLSRAVKPWRMNGCFKAKVTLELAAGSIDKLGVKKGDKCQWQE